MSVLQKTFFQLLNKKTNGQLGVFGKQVFTQLSEYQKELNKISVFDLSQKDRMQIDVARTHVDSYVEFFKKNPEFMNDKP